MGAQWRRELDLIARLIELWADHEADLSRRVMSNKADRFRQRYNPAYNAKWMRKQISGYEEHQTNLEKSGATEDEKAKVFPIEGYLSVGSVAVGNPSLFPVLAFTARRRGDALDFSLRMVTLFLDEHQRVEANGWRFDMPDDVKTEGEGHHHFPHVQIVTAWTPSGDDFHPTGVKNINETGEGMRGRQWNESRPAFPLPSTSPAGIVVAAMTSLYGSKATWKMLSDLKHASAEFRAEAKSILRYG